MINLINVKKIYKKRTLFANVNIEINKPGIYCFIGENGSGKTTLLNLIAGFIKPSSGKITNKCKNCSFISQKVNMIENLTVKEHFKLFNLDCTLLKKFNLYSKVNKLPSELSLGMRQRIAVLIGLYNSAPLIILDEPTSHLDYYNSLLIMREIKIISSNKIILLVTHDENIVEKYGDYVYKIENENIVKIKESDKSTRLSDSRIPVKVLYRNYFKKTFKRGWKIKIYYFIVFFFLLSMINISVNLKNNFSSYFNVGEPLDYNKFYLKECVDEDIGKLIVKKCFNLSENNIEIFDNSEHELSLNYDVLLNDLYGVNNLNVINSKNANLKEGRYPQIYNEIITSDNHSLGDEIVIENIKIIKGDRTDIYKNELKLKVVGVVNTLPFIEDDKIYLDRDLIESYLKRERLINNDKSLFEYFQDIELNNYKYVLYFNTINLEILNLKGVEYLSSSYEYYNGVKEAFEKIIKYLYIYNILVIGVSLFYVIRLIKKKVVNEIDDIIFFKASGIKKRGIIKLLNQENKMLVFLGSLLCLVINLLLIKIIFRDGSVDYISYILSVAVFAFLSKKILKIEIGRKMAI